MHPMTIILLEKEEFRLDLNLRMAEKFHDHPVFEQKFLNQAIDCEAEIAALKTFGFEASKYH